MKRAMTLLSKERKRATIVREGSPEGPTDPRSWSRRSLRKGPNIPRRHQPGLVAKLLELAAQMMRADARSMPIRHGHIHLTERNEKLQSSRQDICLDRCKVPKCQISLPQFLHFEQLDWILGWRSEGSALSAIIMSTRHTSTDLSILEVDPGNRTKR
jgi:hypothetical protein